ncbi:MAG: Rrf2 family transcriptional regulator [Candidatus Marinimicrobia bacterium]|jgi:Rrf2 family protein|nr:Rrf2 family transcriptional regulator [Candidatus Neomarinimicrobiota bacterium]MBT3618752.1 Rrf2 family transcriptional regulator [Candidatus Neomarinimicrobiota bacterium]MBT3828319.1 Rrf2 family transcriptional regulator [Candidatus Neomarinimicrobiota bacterium]MBT3997220.1 Rrf2 family transcriptional regulator [Candidatus Neomarinimicrobiota bacterium]MBT4280182.1 Rrf2 family transcriptional regulator [Candidatus Neomarinimicrobiota bacterium]
MTYSKQVQYALQMLIHLDQSEEDYLTVNDIALKSGMPSSFLATIANELAKRRLLLTQRGRNGGIKLARPANQITVKDVVTSVGSYSEKYHECLIGKKNCTDIIPCSVCRGFRTSFANEFYKRSIRQLLNEEILNHDKS